MSSCHKNYRTDNCHKSRDLRFYECRERFEVTTVLYWRIRVCQIRHSVCGLVLHLWKEGSAVMFNIKGSKKNNSTPVGNGSNPTTISHRRKVTSRKKWILIVNFISDLVFLSACTEHTCWLALSHTWQLKWTVLRSIHCCCHILKILPWICRFLKNKRPTWCHLLFNFTSYVLSMFRTLIYPSSGACDCVVELPYPSSCS